MQTINEEVRVTEVFAVLDSKEQEAEQLPEKAKNNLLEKYDKIRQEVKPFSTVNRNIFSRINRIVVDKELRA